MRMVMRVKMKVKVGDEDEDEAKNLVTFTLKIVDHQV